ncbi:lipopolysaccharide biosynthesis protein [Mycobacterium sp. ITM-2016-00317]|uniref:lipopolysaccharide biosynthesis protein n=1 Tax=Mycobacterium sp. ITM-2016-00317 TaxID=2099694 RepID=UPI00287FADF6|nr:lipopolysaccharide biosynthesis protein [Mycobacterium sp. ITM-2016-00317]WNG88956.1 lipopolysaccharide biosynthesis protein [Mycobacterium sp. ITM-2016-00317]
MSRVGIQGLQLITFVIAARWLSPADYGTYAIVAIVVTLSTLVNDFGLQSALVHDANPSASRFASAFWLNAAVGVTSAGMIAAVAYPAQLILEYKDLAVALAVAGSSFALSITVVPVALLQRRLQLGRLAAIEFTANLAGAMASIYLAWLGLGVISLSIGPVVTALLMSFALAVATRYVPTARPTIGDVRALWGFSGSILAFNVTNYLTKNFDILVLTVVSTPQQVGIYSRAYSIFSAPLTQVGAVVGRVLFPMLAQVRDDTAALRDRWLRTTFASTAIFLPVSIAFAVTSPYVIGILFEPRWQPMALIVSILCIGGPVRLVTSALGYLYQATGHTKELFRVTLAATAALTVGVLAGAAWGPIGIAWGVAIATNVQAYVPLSVGLRFINMTVRNLLFEFRWLVVAGVVQLLVMGGIRLGGGFGSDWASLLGSLALGLASYGVTAWILDRRFFGRLVGRAV